MTLAAVWKIGDWKKSKYPNKKDGKFYDNKVIIFKGVGEDNKNVEYMLNLNMGQPQVVASWEKDMKPGVVYDLPLMAKGSGFVKNDTTVNKFGQFKVVEKPKA